MTSTTAAGDGPMSTMTRRIALVTGASRGIGRAVARALSAQGHVVAVGYTANRELALATVDEITSSQGQALAVQIDVTDRSTIESSLSHIETELGSVSILVNNAGITADGLFAKMGHDRWRRVLETNLDGVFNVTSRVVPGMLRARYGRIVNIGSAAALHGSAGQVNYAAAKAGLVGLTRSLAREVASRAITCNVIAPGPIVSDMTAALSEKRRQELLALVPAGCFGRPEDVAAGVAFLASDAAAYITGAVIPVDGGIAMGH